MPESTVILVRDASGDAYFVVDRKLVGFFYVDQLQHDADVLGVLEIIGRSLEAFGATPNLLTADLDNVLTALANPDDAFDVAIKMPPVTAAEDSKITGEQSALAVLLEHHQDWLSQFLIPYDPNAGGSEDE